MSNYLSDLTTARDNIAAQLAEITADPKPSYSIDDQWIDWATHFKALTDRLTTINAAIQAAEPFEIHTLGETR